MAWVYEKSATWRWLVARSKASRLFYTTFAAACIGVPCAAGVMLMSLSNTQDKATRLRNQMGTRGSSDAQLMGRVNSGRLNQLLSEIRNKEDTEDRYVAALRGETLTGTPQERVRGGGGTSMTSRTTAPQSAPPQSAPQSLASVQSSLSSSAVDRAVLGESTSISGRGGAQ
ncbi:hypothetical protein CBR_g2846 [Chara braunii]|uniref:Uncharacterized protein n=1 Tax=Chara braunii TaxID=69332 RepID=A0A388KE17_CHABU|nr:hypothetical protein CBR_g2846 [Chara braunii]|eukprot:GBG68300.1 hypothetical protein CBR_g2846 [Chara braunii]